MKLSRFLIPLALLPIGCGQGSTSAPPPAPAVASSTPAAAAAPATAIEALPATTPAAAEPVASTAAAVQAPTPSTARARAPLPQAAPSRPAARPAVPAVGASAGGAPAPAAAAEKSAAAPSAPVRVRYDVPAGALLPIEIQTTLSSATSREGDPALAVLTEDVALQGFKLDKGAEVRGRVRTVISAKRVKGRARLVLNFDAVMKNGEKLSIATEAFDSEAPSTASKDKKIIAGGAVGGLVLGAIKSGKKGAAVGTILGATAGGGAVLIMKGDEVEIPRGARLTLVVK